MCEINENEVSNFKLDKNFKLYEDEQFKGLDRHAAQTWIYPTNLPLRQYQFDIVQTALFHNTMVNLPTGLGKTMIAAVIIYNIYRWYPLEKVIFMAPTRPLVCQQANACKKITCIPPEHIAQLTGDVQSVSRGSIWEKTRVFFLTPQILQRDLLSKICPANQIRCIVIDEAHRARGNHSYCEVMRLLGNNAARIRILALSATPGATPIQVAEVAKILRIARLEVRTESSEDVKPYLFSKTIETVVVSLEEPLLSIKDEYIQILDYYTRRLMKSGVLTGSAGNIHKGRIFMVQKEYKAHCQRLGKRPDSTILQDLSFCLTLYHAYEVLVKHGLRGFLSFYNDHGSDKGWIRKNEQLMKLLDRIRNYLGPGELNISTSPDGIIPEIDKNVVFGHPKFYKLRDIVRKHFQDNPDTRVMIFCEYRDSVQEAFISLLTYRPLIRPRMFLGQSAISQKQQLSVMAKFRKGECNTLICTCVAEEGLDVAEVQLIICFDVANRSPIRLAQRMGRTGRHQTGRIVILVTEGKEQQMLTETMQQSSLLDERLLQSPIIRSNMLSEGPSILPPDIKPQCLRLHITPVELTSNFGDEKHIKLLEKINKKMVIDTDINLEGVLASEIPLFTEEYLWKYSKSEFEKIASSKRKKLMKYSISIFKEIDNSINLIKPSLDTQALNFLYRKCEDLKFNLPSTFQSIQNVKTKNQDIRQMFGCSTQSQKDVFITSVDESEQIIPIKKSSKSVSLTTAKRNAFLLTLQSELNTQKSCELLLENKCSICDKIFDCTTLTKCLKIDEYFLPILPSVLNDNTLNCLSYDNLLKLHIKDVIDNLQNYESNFDFESHNNEMLFENLRKNCNNTDDSLHYLQNTTLNPILTFENKNIQRSLKQNSEINNITSDYNVNDISFNKSIKNNLHITNLTFNSIVNENLVSKILSPLDKDSLPAKCHKKEIINDSIYKNNDNLETSVLINDSTSLLKPSEVSVYVPDEISTKALEFFGLQCLENLFNDESVSEQTNRQKLMTKVGKTKEKNCNFDFITNQSCVLNKNETVKIDLCSPVKESKNQHLSTSNTITYSYSNVASQKQLTFPLNQIQISPKNLNKMEKNNILWDESLFLDDSEVENKNNMIVSNQHSSLNTIRKSNNNLTIETSPVLFSQRQKHETIGLHQISPIISSQRVKTLNNMTQQINSSIGTHSAASVTSMQQTSPIISSQREVSLNNVSRKLNLSNIFCKMDYDVSHQLKSNDMNYMSDDDIFADDDLENILSENTKDKRKYTSALTQNDTILSLQRQNLKSKNNFQLKRFVTENLNSKTIENSTSNKSSPILIHKQNIPSDSSASFAHNTDNTYNNSDSDDVSLCDFVTPVKKKLKLELQKSATLSSSINDKLESELNYVNSRDLAHNLSTDITSIKTFDSLDKSSSNNFLQFQSKKRIDDCTDTSFEHRKSTKNVACKKLSSKTQRKKRKKLRCSFIDTQAEVLDADETSDYDTDDNDDDLCTSFVDDNIELTQADVDMQAYYLQSVKSPRNGKFKMPHLPAIKLKDICSQDDYKEDNYYVQDSFCGETIVVNSELSLLEIAEMELENKGRNIKRQKNNKKEDRKRIKKVIESSSDEDEEIKRLRAECMKNQSVIN